MSAANFFHASRSLTPKPMYPSSVTWTISFASILRLSRITAYPIGAQRDPSHRVGVGRLMTHLVRRSRRFNYAIRQAPKPGYLHFDQGARIHRARILWRATEDQVAGQQGDEATEVGEDVVDRKDHLADRAFLYDFSVDVGAQS